MLGVHRWLLEDWSGVKANNLPWKAMKVLHQKAQEWAFSGTLTGLDAGTTYYVRAYATNSVGTSYGLQVSFITMADISFSTDIVPILNNVCNGCHTHGWTTSPTPSTFYTRLQNDNYINPSVPTTSIIYIKLNSGHKASEIGTTNLNKIYDWMNQGSLNN